LMTDCCQFVLCPCPDRQEAERIGAALVEEGLAAAVNIITQDSIFRWRGEVRMAEEYLLVIKSTRDHYKRIERKILDMHSYELPGIAVVPVTDGYSPYLEWIRNGGKC